MKKITSVLLCIVLLALSLVACAGGAAGKALDAELALIQEGKYSEVSIFSDSIFADEDADILNAMYAKFKYDIGKEEIAEDSATVEVTITMVDMSAVFSAYVTEAAQHLLDADWDADNSYFIDLLQAEDTATKDFVVTVNMVKVEDAWTIAAEDNDALLDALTGGLISSVDSFGDLFQ